MSKLSILKRLGGSLTDAVTASSIDRLLRLRERERQQQTTIGGTNQMYLFEGDNRRGAIGANSLIGLSDLIGDGGPAGGYTFTVPGFASGANKPALAYIASPPNATAEQQAAIAALPIADQEKLAAVNRAQVYANIAKGLLEEKNPERVAVAIQEPEIQRLANQVPGFMDALQAHANGDQTALDQAKLKMAATRLRSQQHRVHGAKHHSCVASEWFSTSGCCCEINRRT
jgi:hypothetical protein